jgi:hypothetical protein
MTLYLFCKPKNLTYPNDDVYVVAENMKEAKKLVGKQNLVCVNSWKLNKPKVLDIEI